MTWREEVDGRTFGWTCYSSDRLGRGKGGLMILIRDMVDEGVILLAT